MSDKLYSFSVAHAQEYGVEAAVLIHNFQWWIGHNKTNGKHSHDGRTWTYNSMAAFQAQFPFWKKGQIERLLRTLVDQEILVKGNYNANTYDRTCWYAFKDEKKFLAFEFAHFSKTGNGELENGKWISRNQEILTDRKPDSKPDAIAADAAPKPAKKAPKAKARTSLSEEWKLGDSDRQYALSEGVPASRLEREAQRFRDHHISKGSLMADWSAAWRTWVGNYLKWNPSTEPVSQDSEQAKWAALYEFFDKTGRWREAAYGPAPYTPGHRGPRKQQPQQALI